MADWQLTVQNIGGFKDEHKFPLKEGLNIIIGNNATGKTSLINAIKILNNIPKNQETITSNQIENRSPEHLKYLNTKSQFGHVELKNSDIVYFNSLTSPIKKITEFLKPETSSPLEKEKPRFISNNPEILNFSFIDKTNPLMEQVEYTGSISSIKNNVFRLSKIHNYEEILAEIKKINMEYHNAKDNAVDHLHEQRKEIELNLENFHKDINSFQAELKKLTYNEESADEYEKLNSIKSKLDRRYNNLYFKEFEKLNEELAKNQVLLEKDIQRLEIIQNKKKKLTQYADIKRNIEKNEKKIQDLDKNIKNKNNIIQDITEKKNRLNSQIKILENTIQEHEEHGVCEYCLNKIDKSKLSKEIEKLETKKREFLDKINNLNEEIKNSHKKRNEINDMLINQKNIPIEIAKTKKKIESYKKRIHDKNKKNIDLKREIERIQIELDGIKIEIQKIDKDLINLSDYDDSLKEKQTELLSKINYVKDESSKLKQKKTRILKKIMIVPEKYNLLINRTKIIINTLNETIEKFYFEFIDNINHKLDKLIESLNWSFNRIYVNDDLEIQIENKDYKMIEFTNLSGFERKSIAILLLAISKIQYFPDYPIFAIDEHLNSADPSRFINFIDFLYEMMKDNVILFLITSLPFEQKIESIADYNKQNIGDLAIYNK